jgi:hypothetical protein
MHTKCPYNSPAFSEHGSAVSATLGKMDTDTVETEMPTGRINDPFGPPGTGPHMPNPKNEYIDPISGKYVTWDTPLNRYIFDTTPG